MHADAGIRLGDGFDVDPVDHYFTDDQMIAVNKYNRHPITRALALSIYPGARPVETIPAAQAITTALFLDERAELPHHRSPESRGMGTGPALPTVVLARAKP
jgi:hypothetical protein